MNPMRGFGFAAVWASTVHAGTIASRNGRPTATPAPRRKVRRERCFLVRNMSALRPVQKDRPYGYGRARPSGRADAVVDTGSASGTLRIWNGALFTMPITSDENR